MRGDEEQGAGACGGNGPVRVATGEVIEIGKHSFKVRLDNGEVYTIKVSPCTQLNANKPGYRMKKGDVSVVKGVQKGAQEISVSQVTCLSSWFDYLIMTNFYISYLRN